LGQDLASFLKTIQIVKLLIEGADLANFGRQSFFINSPVDHQVIEKNWSNSNP